MRRGRLRRLQIQTLIAALNVTQSKRWHRLRQKTRQRLRQRLLGTLRALLKVSDGKNSTQRCFNRLRRRSTPRCVCRSAYIASLTIKPLKRSLACGLKLLSHHTVTVEPMQVAPHLGAQSGIGQDSGFATMLQSVRSAS